MRSLTAATALLERTTPEPPPRPEDGAFVTAESMQEAASRAEATLVRIAMHAFAAAESWPRCRACGQRIAPQDGPHSNGTGS